MVGFMDDYGGKWDCDSYKIREFLYFLKSNWDKRARKCQKNKARK